MSFYGLGLVVSKDGQVSADKKTIVPSNTYTAHYEAMVQNTLAPTDLIADEFMLFRSIIPEKST